MQKHVGTVVDEDGIELEIWLELSPEKTPLHVYIMYVGVQQGDFPFNQPDHNCEVSEAAQEIASNPFLKRLELPVLIYTEEPHAPPTRH